MTRTLCLIFIAACAAVLLCAGPASAFRQPEVHSFETATHRITIRVQKDGDDGAPSLGDVNALLKDAPAAAGGGSTSASEEAAAAAESKQALKQEVKKDEEKAKEADSAIVDEEKKASAKVEVAKDKAKLKEEKEEEKVAAEKEEVKAKEKAAKAETKLEEKEEQEKGKIEEEKTKAKLEQMKEEEKLKSTEDKERAEIAKDKEVEAEAEKKEQKAEQDEAADEENNTGSADDSSMYLIPPSGYDNAVGAGDAPTVPDSNGCTDNCEANEAKPVEAAGPTGFSLPVGDAEDPNFTPVKDTQTEASPPPLLTVGQQESSCECDECPCQQQAAPAPAQQMLQEAPTRTIPIGGAPYRVATAPGPAARAVQRAAGEHGVAAIAPRDRFQEVGLNKGVDINIDVKRPGGSGKGQEQGQDDAQAQAEAGIPSEELKEEKEGEEQAEKGAVPMPQYGVAPPPGAYLKAKPLGAGEDAEAAGYDALLGATPPAYPGEAPAGGNIRPATPTMATPNSVVSTMPLSLNNMGLGEDSAAIHDKPSGGCGCGQCPCQQQDCGCVVCPCPGPVPYPDLVPGFGKEGCPDDKCMSPVDKMKLEAKMAAERREQKQRAQREAEREKLHDEMYKHQANYNAIARMARALRFQYAELKRTHDALRGQILASKAQLGDVKNLQSVDFDGVSHKEAVAKLGETIEAKHKSQTAVLTNAHEVQKYELCVFFHTDPTKCPKPPSVKRNEGVANMLANENTEAPENKPLPPIDGKQSK